MKKLLLLLLLLAASLVLVSCPGPDDPSNLDDVTPPVNIYSLSTFTDFTEGFWQSLDDEDDYFWVTPTEIILSDNLSVNASHSRCNLTKYTVTSNTYAEYVTDFPLDNSVRFNYKTIFSSDSSIYLGNGSSEILSFFGKPSSGYPFAEYNSDYKYYIGVLVHKDSTWSYNYNWYYKADDYSHSTITLDDIEGTYVYNKVSNWQPAGTIVISNGEWHYYGESSDPLATSGTVRLVSNDIEFKWGAADNSWSREETFKIYKDGSTVSLDTVTSDDSDLFESFFNREDDSFTFTYSDDVNFDPSSYNVSLEDFEGTYTFETGYYGEYSGSITISNGSWSYSGDKSSPAASSGSVTVDGRKLKFSWDVAGISTDESFEITVNGSGSMWNSANDYVSTFFSMLFGVTDLNMSFNYSTDTSGGSGGGSGSGSLSDYIGTYEYSGAEAPACDGSITISDGSWSFDSTRGHAITTGSVEMDGSNVKLNYTTAGMDSYEIFEVTINDSSATWHCIDSGGYTAYVSTLFSGIFGVADTDMTFDFF